MNYIHKRSTVVLSIISLCIMGLLLTPALALAKNGRGEEKREEKREQKELKKEQKFQLKFLKMVERDDDDEEDDDEDDNKRRSECPRAFGHLIAPGWINKNGTTSIPSNCPTPFGIWKKLPSWMLPGTGTTTPIDTTAPVITNIQSYAFSHAAFIWWTTNEPADAALFWSTSSPVDVNSSSTSRVERSTRTKNHHVYIGPLAATTTYHAVIRARDKAGNTTYSAPFSFTTGSGVVITPVDTVAPSISAVSATTSTSTIAVGWTTNEPTRARLYYATATPVVATSSTAFMEQNTLLTNHSFTISGLSASTTYYLLPYSKDAAGNATTSAEFATSTLTL